MIKRTKLFGYEWLLKYFNPLYQEDNLCTR